MCDQLTRNICFPICGLNLLFYLAEILHAKLLIKPIPIDNALENNLGHLVGK